LYIAGAPFAGDRFAGRFAGDAFAGRVAGPVAGGRFASDRVSENYTYVRVFKDSNKYSFQK